MKTNPIAMNTLRSTFGTLVVAGFAIAAFSLAPFAYAQSVDSSGGCCGADLVGSGYSYTPSYGADFTGSGYSYTPSYGADLVGSGYSYTPSYGADLVGSGYSYTPSYSSSSGYYTSGYSLSGGGYGFSTPMYLGGGGGGYNSSSVYAPTNTWDNGNTYTYAPTQTNTCTAGNSCNTNIVTNTTNPTPVVIQQQQQQQQPVYYGGYTAPTYTCNTCGCAGYPVCQTTPPPVAYVPPVQQTPYITLSQVPYTGLDLGFWGTIAYWGFFILWCLAAAYLIVVKKVQNRIYLALKHFLFGEPVTEAEQVAEAQMVAPLDLDALASQVAARISPQVATSNGASVNANRTSFEDKTDEFVLSQIHRPLR